MPPRKNISSRPLKLAAPQLSPVKHQTKTQALTSSLLQLAEQMGPDARLPTMQELSQSLHVSMMTLNRALSELEAQGVIYRRQGSGTYVSPRPAQRTIGLVYDRDIFHTGTSPFCGLLVDEARRRAASGDEKFSFYLAIPSAEGEPVHEDLVEDIGKRRVDGILFVGEANPKAAKWLQKQKLPLVALAYTPVAPWRVKIDWPQVAQLGVETLAAQGCKKIGLWVPLGVGLGRVGGAKSFPELDAFRDALKAAGLKYNEKHVWQLENLTDEVPATPGVTNQEQGYRAAFETFADKKDAPDGLVILDDMMTRGALVTLDQLDIRVGQDVKIATHLNRGSDALRGHREVVSTIEIDPAEITQAMFDMLETLMEGETPETSPLLIEPRLG
jgi:DNA-binding LacI/PurR family transcriptional regulator